MDPVTRRKMLHKMGLVGPLPTVHDQRRWALIDDRVPPEGEADGEFTSHIQWVNKASSWIGFTGAKCFDTKNRPCRNGGDMKRAHDEGAFPVRWYWPDRFPEPQPELTKAAMAVLSQLYKAEGFYLPSEQIMSHTGKAKARRPLLAAIEAAGYTSANDEGYVLTPFGQDEYPYELQRSQRVSYARRY